jgi:PAS domain S-box-containing protein
MDRDDLLDLLARPSESFREAAAAFSGTEPVAFSVFDGAGVPGWDGLLPREQCLVWKAWVLDNVLFGITLSGAAYEDNPIVYANRTFRAVTGYTMADLHGENPRLLQGPATEDAAVGTLHKALRGWDPVTTELWNYRADGERFRNRVSLLPMPDGTGTVTHWYGVQERIDG